MGTIRLRLTCLDQLILAKEQLEQMDSANGRLAHILTDNAIELMLHYQAEQTLRNKGCYPEIRALTKDEEADCLGRHLKAKIGSARKLGVIGDDEAEYILINHDYRNEVYHAGLRHERVIWDLAWHYHSFACSLIPKVKLGIGHSWQMGKEVSPRLKNFILTEDELAKGDVSENLSKICASVTTKTVKPKGRLGKALAEAINEDADAVDER